MVVPKCALCIFKVSADDESFVDPHLCLSPAIPSFYEACGLMSALPYGFMACSPVILERLGPHILRSHVSTAQYKPIPHSKNEKNY